MPASAVVVVLDESLQMFETPVFMCIDLFILKHFDKSLASGFAYGFVDSCRA
jgi:hypothetical protein